jgi:hypothetical protein
MQPEPVTAQMESVQIQTETTTTTVETKPATTETKVEVKQEVKAESSANTTEQKETKTEGNKIEVPKGKQLVPGFGLVMSLEILNAPAIQQEQTLAIALDYTQELPDGIRRNTDFLLQLLTDNDVGDSFRNRNDRLWGNLRWHNDIQPCYSCD